MCARDLLIYEAASSEYKKRVRVRLQRYKANLPYLTEERRKQDSHIIRGMSGVCLSCWGIGQGLGPTRAQARG